MRLSELKHLAILKQAKQEFISKGYLAANLDHICRDAGVSKRTLYRHFENKLELFKSVLLDLHQKLHSPTTEIPYDPGMSLEQQLVALLDQQQSQLTSGENMKTIRMMLTEFLQQPAMAQQLLGFIQSQHHSFDEWIAAASAAGKLSGNIEAMNRTLKSLFNGAFLWPMLFQIESVSEDSNHDKVDEITQVFLAAYGDKDIA
ncbi:TetR/AcrR family transcriptional regulator [Shewanella sp. NIFS-20-20]|uniref:TetR/AcrR family transcriptional regulator n=1 Tax=Shewanella sp. NIFS-20-20 TaxID=2853806 RepID=UPI001C4721BD|nr:TetR/AcrR family transcriptional regulator [Shewanella sp. NIFS-20-20]MBV7316240.1 TetR/AcrR family transcriptional regulator [Shewanella sp. NIFS-20-20]